MVATVTLSSYSLDWDFPRAVMATGDGAVPATDAPAAALPVQFASLDDAR